MHDGRRMPLSAPTAKTAIAANRFRPGELPARRASAHFGHAGGRLRPWIRVLVAALVLTLLPLAGNASKKQATGPRGHGLEYAGGYSSTNLKPFDPRVRRSFTPRLDETSLFTVRAKDNPPILDGAEALFPLYAAFAGACYPDLRRLSISESVRYDSLDPERDPLRFSNSVVGFERLLRGEVDIFFGAAPSTGQRFEAAMLGRELTLTPIGREGFVFFVNEHNPVDELTTLALREILSGRVEDWSVFGGPSTRIEVTQRPRHSGAQSILEEFMDGRRLAPPMRRVPGMGPSLDKSADRGGGRWSLGYSFHFFMANMRPTTGVKMLAVNGVAPNAQTIASGEYPLVVPVYAITLKGNPNPHIPTFLEWMCGSQGQELVEKTGYARLQPQPGGPAVTTEDGTDLRQ